MNDAIALLLSLGLTLLIVGGLWRTYSKAGQPGWACIIPIYNVIALLAIVGKPWWWILLLFVPLVNFVVVLYIYMELARVFGYGFLFGLGLIFLSPIFICILGYGDAQYLGPDGSIDYSKAKAYPSY